MFVKGPSTTSLPSTPPLAHTVRKAKNPDTTETSNTPKTSTVKAPQKPDPMKVMRTSELDYCSKGKLGELTGIDGIKAKMAKIEEADAAKGKQRSGFKTFTKALGHIYGKPTKALFLDNRSTWKKAKKFDAKVGVKLEQAFGFAEKNDEELDRLRTVKATRVRKGARGAKVVANQRFEMVDVISQSGAIHGSTMGESLEIMNVATPYVMVGGRAIGGAVDIYEAALLNNRLKRIDNFIEESQDVLTQPQSDLASNTTEEMGLGDVAKLAKKNTTQSLRHRMVSAACNIGMAIGTGIAIGVVGLAVASVAISPVGWVIAGASIGLSVGLVAYTQYKKFSRVEDIKELKSDLKEAMQQELNAIGNLRDYSEKHQLQDKQIELNVIETEMQGMLREITDGVVMEDPAIKALDLSIIKQQENIQEIKQNMMTTKMDAMKIARQLNSKGLLTPQMKEQVLHDLTLAGATESLLKQIDVPINIGLPSEESEVDYLKQNLTLKLKNLNEDILSINESLEDIQYMQLETGFIKLDRAAEFDSRATTLKSEVEIRRKQAQSLRNEIKAIKSSPEYIRLKASRDKWGSIVTKGESYLRQTSPIEASNYLVALVNDDNSHAIDLCAAIIGAERDSKHFQDLGQLVQGGVKTLSPKYEKRLYRGLLQFSNA